MQNAAQQSKKIKVVHLITSLSEGGAQTALYNLLSETDRNRFDPVVISLTDKLWWQERIEALGVPVHSLNMAPSRPTPWALFKLVRHLRREKPDVLQTWLYHADLLGLVAKVFAPVKRLAWNIRCSFMDFSQYSPMTGFVVKLLARWSGCPDAVVVNSKQGKTFHAQMGYDPKRWQYMPNGFNLERFKPNQVARAAIRDELGIPPDAPVIGMVARLDAMKDHNTFLRAAEAVIAKHPEAHFILVGKGYEADNDAFPLTAYHLDLRAHLHLLGQRQDVADVVASFDISCLSSLGEGFPNAVGEAMAAGVVTTATDVGDARSIIDDDSLIVPVGDVQALTQAWLDLLSLSSHDLKAKGLAARQRIVDHYALAAIANRYAEFYEDLVKG